MSRDNRPKVNAKKIVKIVFILLYQILVIMALILTMIIVLQRVTNSNQSIGGYRIFRVITGSMEPEYQVGEVVISKEVNPEDIQVGDDIVYLGRNGEYAGKIIMHNVIGIRTDENGDLIFSAKGLHSNSVEDPQIREEQIYGVVKVRAGVLTILYNLATNIYSIFVIIIILVLNVFIAFNTPKKTKKRKVKQIEKVRDEVEETFFDEEVDEDIDGLEDVENVEDVEEELEEEEFADIEENDIVRNEDDIEEEEDEDIEENQHVYVEKIRNESSKRTQSRAGKIENSKPLKKTQSRDGKTKNTETSKKMQSRDSKLKNAKEKKVNYK